MAKRIAVKDKSFNQRVQFSSESTSRSKLTMYQGPGSVLHKDNGQRHLNISWQPAGLYLLPTTVRFKSDQFGTLANVIICRN